MLGNACSPYYLPFWNKQLTAQKNMGKDEHTAAMLPIKGLQGTDMHRYCFSICNKCNNLTAGYKVKTKYSILP